MTRVLLVALLLSALPSASAAQDSSSNGQIAMARSLFEQGLEHGNQQRWPEAIDLFRRSVALYPSPNASFNLAYALGQVGQRVEAAELYEQVVGAASAPVELRRQAQQRVLEMRRETARLTVQLSGATSDVTVRVGHLRLPPAALGVPIPVDTGPHDVDVLRGDDAVVSRHFDLRAGQSLSLSILVPGGGSSIAESPWLWILVGVAVVGAGVGIGLGFALSSTEPSHVGNVPPGVVELP